MGVHSRSFLKGKRFAFKNKDKLMCCERCVFGSGAHSCVTSSEASREPAKPFAVPRKRRVYPNPTSEDYRKYGRMACTSKVRKRVEEALEWAKAHGVFDVGNIAARRLKGKRRLLSLHEI